MPTFHLCDHKTQLQSLHAPSVCFYWMLHLMMRLTSICQYSMTVRIQTKNMARGQNSVLSGPTWWLFPMTTQCKTPIYSVTILTVGLTSNCPITVNMRDSPTGVHTDETRQQGDIYILQTHIYLWFSKDNIINVLATKTV